MPRYCEDCPKDDYCHKPCPQFIAHYRVNKEGNPTYCVFDPRKPCDCDHPETCTHHK